MFLIMLLNSLHRYFLFILHHVVIVRKGVVWVDGAVFVIVVGYT